MRIRHRGLRRLYEADDRRYLNPQHVDKIQRILAFLEAAQQPADMRQPDFRLHPLRGDRDGTWSVSVSGNWRITFRFKVQEAVDVDLEDYH